MEDQAKTIEYSPSNSFEGMAMNSLVFNKVLNKKIAIEEGRK